MKSRRGYGRPPKSGLGISDDAVPRGARLCGVRHNKLLAIRTSALITVFTFRNLPALIAQSLLCA